MCDTTEQTSEHQHPEDEELSAPLLQTLGTENESGNEEGEVAESPVMKHLGGLIHIYSDQSGNFSNITKGLSIVFVFGALLGIVMPNNNDLPNAWYQTFSSIIGYIYFVSWSVSFYPQIITNYQRKHITGLSTDSSILAVLNYTCYAIYNVFFYFDETIRKEYKNRHGEDAKITVQSNDVMFSIHALFLTSILLTQIIYYGGFRSNPISKITVLIVALVLLCSSAYIAACIYAKGWLWIDFLYLLASFKLILTVLTYVPQVILNFWRKSTTGWNIWNVIFDFTGGILSLLQLVLDSVDLHDLRHGILGNWAKLVLSLITLCFDTVFFCQHYMYSNEDENVDEEEVSNVYDLLEDGR